MIPNVTSPKVAVPAALFLALSPGMLLKTSGTQDFFQECQHRSHVRVLPRISLPHRVLSRCSRYGCRTHQERSSRGHHSFHGPQPGYASYDPSR